MVHRTDTEEKQNQHAILIVVQGAIAGVVALAANIVEAFKQGSELIEVFQATDILLLDLILNVGFGWQLRGNHAVILPNSQAERNTVQIYLAAANCVPNTIELRPLFLSGVWYPCR